MARVNWNLTPIRRLTPIILAVFIAGCATVPAGSKHRILVTNDDGIDAPGIAALVEAMKPFGEVVVVAPATDQSGKSHSVSILSGVPAIAPVTRDGVKFGDAVDGTPADSVLAAVYYLHRETKFDLVVSGINRGANVGVGSLYSGTVGAALEGALAGIPAVAFSQDHTRTEYTVSAAIAANVVEGLLQHGLEPHTFLNVNIPAGELKGIRIAPMGDALYVLDRFEPKAGGTGIKPMLKLGDGFLPERDTAYYADGYVTISPLQVDWSAPKATRKKIGRWHLKLPEAAQ